MNDSTSMFSSAPDSAPTTDISKSINHREDTQSSQLLPRRSTCIKRLQGNTVLMVMMIDFNQVGVNVLTGNV